MNKSRKPVVLSTAILAVVVIFALAGNAVRSASAKFSLPLFTGKPVEASVPAAPVVSEDAIKLGVFEVKGIVDAIASDSYTVSGLIFKVDASTKIEGTLAVGDGVEVKGFLLADKSWFALKIEKYDEKVVTPEFDFTGVVDTVAADKLTVSGVEVGVSPTTKIDAGVESGALVEVKGTIEAGKLVAAEVSLEAKAGQTVKVELVGVIDSISGMSYVISGKTVNTDAATVISGTLAVGNVVKVEALLNTDGSLMATAIDLVQGETEKNAEDQQDQDKNDPNEDKNDQDEDKDEQKSGKEVEIKGTVESFSETSIVVGGVTFTINEKTEIEGKVAVGATVKIEGVTQTDGTAIAREIKVKESSPTPSGDSSKSSDDHHEDDQEHDD